MNAKQQASWRIPKPSPALQAIFTAKLGLSEVVGQVLVNRGITSVEEARIFLYGGMDHLHDPHLLKDIDLAVERIKCALMGGEKIRIFGDYDADGVTATALLMKVLLRLGAAVDYYIPERLSEGYGLNEDAVRAAKKAGVDLIVTVDSGIAAFEEVNLAADLGLDVIITDHHEVPEVLPVALAVINPKRTDCLYPFKELAGVGVAYKLASALLQDGDGAAGEGLLELVCLGTVADIVALQGENRILVKKGLQALSSTQSPGLRALMKQGGILSGDISARQVAFQLAPRINAAGRMGDATLALKMLLSDRDEDGSAIAAQLSAVNEERQSVEAAIYQEARQCIENGEADPERDKIIVLAREGWHLGVIGIVASKLVQEFYRPVVLMSIDGDYAKGSARSIPTFNIFQAFRHQEHLLTKFGGHKQAAGLTIPQKNIRKFTLGLKEYAESHFQPEDLVPEIRVDSWVSLDALNENLYRQLQLLAPYGHQNPEPVFACAKASVFDFRTVGTAGTHLKLKVGDSRIMHDAIGFNLGVHESTAARHQQLDLVFALEKNEWNGRSSLQLKIQDIRPSGTPEDLPGDNSEPLSFVDGLFRDAASYLTDEYYRDIAEKEVFFTKIAGVTFENRQETAAGLRPGERLRLVRDGENPCDCNAVRVETSCGTLVGFLNARLAKHLAPVLDRGEEYLIQVSQVTGGDGNHYGVNVVVQKLSSVTGAENRSRAGLTKSELAGLDEAALLERIRENLLGDRPYRPKQTEALSAVLKGENSLAIFGTGRGKSAVFQTAAVIKAVKWGEMTVILYPLRALVNDQYENMSRRLQPLGIRIYKGNGSISDLERARLFEALQADEIDILLTTPEFVTHHLPKLQAMNKKVGLLVVDESHHIGLASAAHRPLYKRLGDVAKGLGSPVVLALTATADNQVAGEIIETLGITRVIIDPHVRTNLRMTDKRDWPDKKGYLKQVAAGREKTIVYVNSRQQAVELAAMLREELPDMNQKIVFYHAGLKSEDRNAIERMFKEGEVTTVVSTSAFGEGIDITDIRHVILYHLNFNETEFNQQCGRCGRGGQPADIHLLCGRPDAVLNKFLLETSAPDRSALAALYVALRDMAAQNGLISASNEELAKVLKKGGIQSARPGLISAGLGILEELGLICRENMGRNRTIELLPPPREKLNIERSLRFIEGQEEKAAFQNFADYFFRAGAEDLLNLVNRPIYPDKYQEAEIGVPMGLKSQLGKPVC